MSEPPEGLEEVLESVEPDAAAYRGSAATREERVLRWRWREGKRASPTILWVGLAMIVAFFVLGAVFLEFDPDSLVALLLFGAPLLLAALIAVHGELARLINRSELRIGSDSISLRSGPMRAGARFHIALADVVEVRLARLSGRPGASVVVRTRLTTHHFSCGRRQADAYIAARVAEAAEIGLGRQEARALRDLVAPSAAARSVDAAELEHAPAMKLGVDPLAVRVVEASAGEDVDEAQPEGVEPEHEASA